MTQSNWSPKYTELRDANGVLKQRTVQREEDGPIEILYQSPEHDVPKIGCVNHDCDRCRALQALHDENERLGLYKDAYAQPEQREPTKQEHNILMGALKRSGKVVAQPEQEPLEDLQVKLKWATEQLEANINWEFVAFAKEEMLKVAWAEIKELREQIKEPEQEPVGKVVDCNELGYPIVHFGQALFIGTLLYTIPPQRTWVGLTEEEVIDLWPDLIMHRHTYQFWQNLETKLKEKNA